ncbi:ArsR/SmtB family transcription factor [Caedibacter taeniospiralis]|uniref:ArsR/SmtB family transcription factor n=1 Tax=Caedibacter taeniospiralis TaxID=28907 RepID=UPI001E3FFC63|nr:metalloregulator ArsR/SmtB family transcription factor [Caedibacter taeniospiralis]
MNLFLYMLDINEPVLKKMADVCHVMGDANRMRILFMCSQSPTPVNCFVESLELSQPLVSHHLKLMRQQRLIKGERQGKQIFYALYDEHVRHMLQDMYQHWVDENH